MLSKCDQILAGCYRDDGSNNGGFEQLVCSRTFLFECKSCTEIATAILVMYVMAESKELTNAPTWMHFARRCFGESLMELLRSCAHQYYVTLSDRERDSWRNVRGQVCIGLNGLGCKCNMCGTYMEFVSTSVVCGNMFKSTIAVLKVV